MVEEEKKPNQGGCLKIFLGVGGGLVALIVAWAISISVEHENKIKSCNEGGEKECQALIDKFGYSLLEFPRDRKKITNPIFFSLFQPYIDAQPLNTDDIYSCEVFIKKRLKDPRSFRANNSTNDQIATGLIDYTATNSFGGAVRSTFNCKTFVRGE